MWTVFLPKPNTLPCLAVVTPAPPVTPASVAHLVEDHDAWHGVELVQQNRKKSKYASRGAHTSICALSHLVLLSSLWPSAPPSALLCGLLSFLSVVISDRVHTRRILLQ